MSASFRSILQQVTQEKLEELKLQKNLMSSHFHPVLQQLETASPTRSGSQRLSLLYTSLTTSPVKDTIDSVLIDNLKYVLQNGEQDPSIRTPQLIDAWIERVKQEIQYALHKCEYSYLYGSLLSEWLEVGEKKRLKSAAAAVGGAGDAPMELEEPAAATTETSDAKAKITSTLKHLMTTAPSAEEFAAPAFRDFLTKELFSFGENVEGESVFRQVVKETDDFFRPENFYISTHDVKCCIRGLNSDELLSPEKKAALKELSDNPEALEEVASLLTTRLKNLDRWDWPTGVREEGIQIRRGLGGEYKAFLNEDIITALFLQYVGVEWAAYFKRQFKRLYDSRAWTKRDCDPFSIEGYRAEFHKTAFLSSLPDSVEAQENKNKDEYAKVETMENSAMAYACAAPMMDAAPPMLFGASSGSMPGQPMAVGRSAKMMTRSIRPPPPPPKPPTDIDFKQQFLHLLCTEIKLNQVLRPEQPLLVVQADLESFGPSVIHDAALIALESLGVKQDWIKFFRKFLEAPANFGGGAGGKVEKSRRGVPSGHALSNLFGETLLFLLEFLVNRKCEGMRIHRISEELWFWSHEPSNVCKAWEALHTYGAMVGLKVNSHRSGSVSVFSPAELAKRYDFKEGATLPPPIVCGPAPLPQRNINWGYLALHSNGVFHIDQKSIEKFLEEMKTLLEKSECTLEWINVFNKYFTFFIRNFGKSAVASGKQHLDQIVGALNKIYGGLGSDPVASLKGRFASLREAQILDAWVYWPLEKGGLGLVNPFIGVMALRETFAENEKGAESDSDFTKLPLQDKILWEEMKKEHEKMYGGDGGGGVEPPMIQSSFGKGGLGGGGPMPPMRPKLPTWPEYVASRETELRHWQERYLRLLERPGPKYPPVSDQFHTLEWRTEDEVERNYFMWLFSYYETQLKGHFGSVVFINSKLLPMSMIANIQKTKVQHN